MLFVREGVLVLWVFMLVMLSKLVFNVNVWNYKIEDVDKYLMIFFIWCLYWLIKWVECKSCLNELVLNFIDLGFVDFNFWGGFDL